MGKTVSPALFALVLLALGIVAVAVPNRILNGVLKVVGSKNDTRHLLFSPKQTLASIRVGGVIALLMAVFVLWTIWYNRGS